MAEVGTAITDAVVNAAIKKFDEAMQRFDDEIKNLKTAGLDSSRYETQQKTFRAGLEDAKKLDGNLAKINALTDLATQAKQAAAAAAADVGRVSRSAVEGITSAVTAMRDGAKQSIDKLDEKVKEKPELAKRLADLDKLIADTGKLTDRAERAKQLKRVNVDAESLFREHILGPRVAATQNGAQHQIVHTLVQPSPP